MVKMANSFFVVFLLLTINVDDYFAMGQSTFGDCSNYEQNKCYSEALLALANGIQSEFHNLKRQISRLENPVERQNLPG